MKVNYNPGLLFQGRLTCKGKMAAMRKKHINKPFSAEESRKLLGTSDISGEYDSEPTMTRMFNVDTNKIVGIDMASIHFVSDDNKIFGALSYQPKNATEVEKKLNYIVALNAYNTAHQNDIETEIVF